MDCRSTTKGKRPDLGIRRFPVIILLFGLLLSIAHETEAGLIINELFRGNNFQSDYVEFLVTSDMTLAELDGIWFGDSKANTKGVDNENSFNAAQIIANVGAFSATTDVLRAGTILTVGGSSVATDFNYNPDSNDPSNTDAWNITLSLGQGVDGSGQPFKLDQNGDVVWLGTSQPSSGSGTSDFLSAIAYDSNPGALAQQVNTLAQNGNTNFQLLTGPDFDGKVGKGGGLTNTGGAEISFGETTGGTLGEANGGDNGAFIYDLRVVPEPSALVPCLLILSFGVYLRFRKPLPATAEA